MQTQGKNKMIGGGEGPKVKNKKQEQERERMFYPDTQQVVEAGSKEHTELEQPEVKTK